MWKYLYRVGCATMFGIVGAKILDDSIIGLVCFLVAYVSTIVGAAHIKD